MESIFFASQDGKTPILYAAWKGHHEVVGLLLEAKADLNLQEKVCLDVFAVSSLLPHSKCCIYKKRWCFVYNNVFLLSRMG